MSQLSPAKSSNVRRSLSKMHDIVASLETPDSDKIEDDFGLKINTTNDTSIRQNSVRQLIDNFASKSSRSSFSRVDDENDASSPNRKIFPNDNSQKTNGSGRLSSNTSDGLNHVREVAAKYDSIRQRSHSHQDGDMSIHRGLDPLVISVDRTVSESALSPGSYLSIDTSYSDMEDDIVGSHESSSKDNSKRRHSVAELRLRFIGGNSIPEPNEIFQKKLRMSIKSTSSVGNWNIRTIDSPKKKKLLISWSSALQKNFGELATIEAAVEFLASQGVTQQEVGSDSWNEWQDAVKAVISNPNSLQNTPDYHHNQRKAFAKNLTEKLPDSVPEGSKSTDDEDMDDIFVFTPEFVPVENGHNVVETHHHTVTKEPRRSSAPAKSSNQLSGITSSTLRPVTTIQRKGVSSGIAHTGLSPKREESSRRDGAAKISPVGRPPRPLSPKYTESITLPVEQLSQSTPSVEIKQNNVSEKIVQSSNQDFGSCKDSENSTFIQNSEESDVQQTEAGIVISPLQHSSVEKKPDDVLLISQTNNNDVKSNHEAPLEINNFAQSDSKLTQEIPKYDSQTNLIESKQSIFLCCFKSGTKK